MRILTAALSARSEARETGVSRADRECGNFLQVRSAAAPRLPPIHACKGEPTRHILNLSELRTIISHLIRLRV